VKKIIMTYFRSRKLRATAGDHTVPFPVFSLFLTLAIILLGQVTFVFADQWNEITSPLRVGFSSRVFPDVDQRDAQVAMELWTRELARGMGIKATPVTVIYKSTADLLEAVKRGELTVATLSAIEYLQIRDRAPMTPVIIAANNAGYARQYVLIARRGSGIRSISDLRGKTIIIPSSIKYEASHIWLHVLLLREVGKDRALFFRQVLESSAASKSILKVFFNQADAAVVSRGALETSKVLNPQIGRKLTVLAESKPLHGDITCVPDMVSEKLKHSITNSALHLHETTVGRQIFTLFQIEKVIPYQSTYLQGLIALLEEQAYLKSKQPKRR
jgi:ABC-type phosphate/phosphonate transport system substrate-binding protein